MHVANRQYIKAKQRKNDEFYTQYKDVEKEVALHKACFKNKIIYCPCDDYEKSEFVHFFLDHFDEYELKGLIATSYAYVGEKERDLFNEEIKKGKVLVKTFDNIQYGFLEGDGDFRSDECATFFKKADYIVTNPPFSLFKDFFSCLKKYNKDFLVLGPVNAITYKEVFPLIKENKAWTTSTITSGHVFFKVPDTPNKGYEVDKRVCIGGKKFVEISDARWFTSFDRIENPFIELKESYLPKKYPKYDNYEAIEINSVKNIPVDYKGIMGVPISFLYKYNPRQFEIVEHLSNPVINGKAIYKRLLIKRKGA